MKKKEKKPVNTSKVSGGLQLFPPNGAGEASSKNDKPIKLNNN